MFAPAGPPDADRLEEGRVMVEQEFPELTLLPSVQQEPAPPFPWLYDSDSGQAAAFASLMQASDVKFVWALRGGYGILRWVGLVDWSVMSEDSPVVTGFSDVTVIHAALNSRGIKTLHAPMLCTLSHTAPESRTALRECFNTGSFPSLSGKDVVCAGDSVRGRLVGGNLCCLCHLVGTPWEPVWAGSILVLEDVNEPLYRIDRMITHLLQSGRLSEVKGIVLGEFSMEEGDESSKMLYNLFKDRLAGLGVPVISGLPVGHGRDNMPLLMGGEYLLEIEECRLVPLESLPK